MMHHTNIEIKARCADHARVRSILRSRNAEYRGLDHQVDTYFNVSRGRLKLREGNIENTLIYYVREDTSAPKQSDVILWPVAPGSPLKNILADALGVLKAVEKYREIYFIENVKFHIDQVVGLGTFVEIEAIDSDGSIGKETLLEQCRHYLELLSISDEDLIEGSYSDMVVK